MPSANGNGKKFDLRERQAGDVTILEVEGNLEIGNGSDALEAKLQELIADGRRSILMECRQVDSIDSSAVGALARSFMSLAKRGGALKLLRISPVVRAALQLVGLIEKIETFDDEAVALASFR